MKIGIISEPLNENPTGVGSYAFNLTEHLIATDKKNDYFLINWKENDFFHQVPKVTLKNPLRKLLPTYGWYPTIPFQIEKTKFDLILNFSQVPNFFRFNSQYIITVFDLTPLILPRAHKTGKSVLFKLLLPRTLRYADNIITVSESTKRDIMKYFNVPENKIKVIYLAANKHYRPIRNNVLLESVREKYSLPSKFILFVGTFEPRKNIPAILKAFRRLNPPDYKLVLVGKRGWKLNQIFQLIDSLNLKEKVLLPGYVETKDLPVFYNLASLFVYPSFYEGFGLPPLEAMACGCPVITSNTSSLPEVVGDAGIMIDPRDVTSIAGAMKMVLVNENLRKEMSLKGIMQAEKFSWEKAATETMELYKS